MTLSEVPTDLLKESLLAIADLRRKYLKVEMATVYQFGSWSCPLCNFAVSFKGKDAKGRCACPWLWIDERRCCPRKIEDDKSPHFQDESIPDRLKRIDRWEAAINAEIANREAV